MVTIKQLMQMTVVYTLVCAMLMASHDALALRGVEKVTEIEGIAEYRLDNGLTVLLFPDPSKETVTVNVTYKVGSKHENYGETGMAHLLEHLLFKGSSKHPDIPEELSKHGAKPNGTTWIDRTNYFETFAATEENIDWALSLESDRMVNSFIAREDLDSEMTVVRNEFERSENNPFRVLMQRMLSTAYLWHNNGNPTIGARSDIENVSIERLRDFYEKYYQPDNAVLTIAGQFEPESMLKKIRKTFGKIPKPKRELEPLYTEEPAQGGERQVVVRRVGDIQWYAAAYHIPAGAHEDFAPVEVLLRVLGDTPRGRLHKNLVEQDLAVAAYAFPFQLESPGMAFLAAQVEKTDDLNATRKAFLDTVENVHKRPISEEEVTRAKRNLIKEIELSFNSSEEIAILLSEYIGMGDWRLLFLTRDRIEAVTADDVQRVADAYFARNNRTAGKFIPTDDPARVEIPKVENLDEMLAGYKGRESLALGEAFEPSFDNIMARNEKLVLDNGAEVVMLPKKTRGESVVAAMRMQFGDLDSLKGRGAVGEMVGSMLMRGTDRYSRAELQDRLDELKASVSVSGDIDGATVQVETTRENLVPTLALVAHVLRSPAFDEAEVEQLRSQYIANLDSARQKPQAIVSREMSRFYSQFDQGHPYYVPTIDEEIAAIQAVEIEEMQAFHREFYGAEQMQIALVGDFDQAAVTETLQRELGAWKTRASYERIPRPLADLPVVDKTLDTPDKENAAIVAMLGLPISQNHEDAPALSMGTYIFGGGFLNSRLATRLRQEEGLSYSAGAWIAMSPLDQRAELSAYAIYAPQNMPAVEQGIRDELSRLLRDGVTEDELASAKTGILQKARVERANDSSLAGQLAQNLYLDRTMEWQQQYEAEIRALTKEQVNRALREHIAMDQLSFVKAGDLAKVENAQAQDSDKAKETSQAMESGHNQTNEQTP